MAFQDARIKRGAGGEIEVTVNSADVERALAELPGVLAGNLRNAFSVVGFLHRNAMLRMHRARPEQQGWLVRQNKAPGTPLSRMSGRLLSDLSQGTDVRGSTLDDLVMVRYIGRGVPYARVHEHGGVIRPRKAKVLTIPTRFGVTRAGLSRGRVIHEPGHWAKSKGGALLFWSDATGLPIALGLPRVTLRPRLRFADTWDKQKAKRRAVYLQAVEAAVRGTKYPQGPAAPGG